MKKFYVARLSYPLDRQHLFGVFCKTESTHGACDGLILRDNKPVTGTKPYCKKIVEELNKEVKENENI